MNAVDVIRRLHQHRVWVNHKLLVAAETLTPEQLRQPIAIGQGSVWRSLTHLFAAEFVWLEALLGKPSAVAPGDVTGKLPGNQMGPDAFQTLQEFRAAWTELDARWDRYLADLDAASLDDLVPKIASLSGQLMTTRRADILLHICTHAQYTTAQTVNMLRQLGCQDLPDVMLISLARQER